MGFARIPFDSNTIFSPETVKKFNLQKIMEDSKRFGSGSDRINMGKAQTLTGKNIHVAVLDQNCNPNLVGKKNIYYKQFLKSGNGDYTCYEHFGDNEDDIENMHGLSVTSLLASESCGVAKDAIIHFYAGNREKVIEDIIEYNKNCKEEDRIVVLSNSQRIKDEEFKKYKDELSEVGCELVCANNFDLYFNEYIENGNSIEIPTDINEAEKDYLIHISGAKTISEMEKARSKIEVQMSRTDNIKIPASTTYHQVGQESGGKEIFKYQSGNSTSWGIPQIAGLFAIFKEKDRNLSFEEFYKFAEKTKSDNGFINPDGIYNEIERKIQKQNEPNQSNDLINESVSITEEIVSNHQLTEETQKIITNYKITEMEKTKPQNPDFPL